jgi:O-antigen/teichoic acid export membrane protein
MALKRFSIDLAALSAGRIVQTVAAFLALPIVARLLGPREYGLVAVAMSFVMCTIYLADAGMGQSLVRTPSSDRTTWSSAFWLISGFGGLLSLILVAVAFVAPAIFGEPRLTGLLLGLAIVPLIVSAIAAPTAELQQRQRFRELAAIEGLSALVGLGVAITLAFRGAGAWSLIIQQVVFWVMKATLVTWRTRFRPSFVFSREDLSEHTRFARDTLGHTLLYFFGRQLDPIVMGRILGAAPTGLYAFAMRVMHLPHQLISSPVQNALFVRMVELREDKSALRDLLLILTTAVALLVFPAVATLAAASPAYFAFLLSDEWLMAAPVFAVLAPVAALQTILVPANALLLATGRTATRLRQTFETAVIWVILLPLSTPFGLLAVAGTFTAVNILYLPRALQLTLPAVDLKVTDFLRILVPAILAALGVCVGHAVLRTYVHMSEPQEILASLTELAIAYALLLVACRGRLAGQIRTLRTLMVRSAGPTATT